MKLTSFFLLLYYKPLQNYFEHPIAKNTIYLFHQSYKTIIIIISEEKKNCIMFDLKLSIIEPRELVS